GRYGGGGSGVLRRPARSTPYGASAAAGVDRGQAPTTGVLAAGGEGGMGAWPLHTSGRPRA
ncbi:hypothetical protein J8J07_23530, partial [Mycobacterium tuberculosis]|nr:hypothetical protein [Mycobacterium tuberculosis]